MLYYVNLAEKLLPHAEDLCRHWLPAGRKVGHEWHIGDIRGNCGSSCKINLRTGIWKDFATTDRGGDLISLCAAVFSISQSQAARKLSAMLGSEADND